MRKKLYKILNLAVISFLSFNTACASIHQNVAAPVDSFTLLSASHTIEICATPEVQQDPEFQESGLPPCATFESKSLASGSVIEHYREPENRERRSLVLTVAHWCQPMDAQSIFEAIPSGGPREMVMAGFYRITNHVSLEYVIDNSGIMHPIIKKISIDNDLDVCLIEVEKLDVPRLRILSRNPNHGDRVLNMAAPWGHFNPPNIYIDEGIYLGECYSQNMCRIPGEFNISGIYAGQGSSGSPILVRRGALWYVAGIIHAVRVAPFGGSYLPMGASVEQIRTVLERDFTPYVNGERQVTPSRNPK